MSTHVLIADDEALIRSSLRALLIADGCAVSVAGSGEEAWRLFQSDRPDVVLLDMVLGDIDGIEVLRRMRAEAPEAKVVLITAHGSIESAVEAMKLGCFDFIKKPFELEEILAAVHNATRQTTLEGRVAYLARRDRAESGTLIYGSRPMQALLDEVDVIASSPVSTVLIMGESGTGKQLVARRFHELSARAAGPFVELNCSAVPESLAESEFFGHERGAFSDARERKLGLVEVADGGTLFLDEIGDLGAGAQAKLLSFLEQRTFRRVGATALRRVDTRVVAATNRDLPAMVAARTFREDLWYRLSAMTVTIPPLRHRPDDIEPLASHFMRTSNAEFDRSWRGLSQEALGLLRGYPWPGNVRELRAVLSRAALLQDDEILRPEHLPPTLIRAAMSSDPSQEAGAQGLGIPTLAQVEMEHIRRVVEICGGNRTLAAQHLGISRQTLTRKLGERDG